MKNKRIAFLCEVPEDYWIFSPVIRNLPAAECIIAPPPRKPAAAQFITQTISDLATQENLKWRFFNAESDWIADFFAPYDLIAGANLEGYLSHPALTMKKKLLFTEQTTSWPGTLSFKRAARVDAIAAPGAYCADAFAAIAPTEIVGSPRLEQATARAAGNAPPSILYAPSAHNIRLRDALAAVEDAIPSSHRLIVRMPTIRARWETRRNSRGSGKHAELVFWGEREPASLVAAADAVIIEDLSLLLDSLFFEKPMVLLDVLFGRQTAREDVFVPPRTTRTFATDDPTIADIGVIVRAIRNLPAALMRTSELRKEKGAIEHRKAISRMMIARPPSGASRAATSFIRRVLDAPRQKESFLARTAEYQNTLERITERMGVRRGALTRSLIRLLKMLEP